MTLLSMPSYAKIEVSKIITQHPLFTQLTPQHQSTIKQKIQKLIKTEHDARMTLELDDRYIIQPSFNWWTKEDLSIQSAEPLPNGFHYSSNNNDDWLNFDRLKELLAGTPD